MTLRRLPQSLGCCSEVVRRFHAAAKAAQGLSHPNVVEILGHSEVNGRHSLVMEYIKGQNLRQRLHVAKGRRNRQNPQCSDHDCHSYTPGDCLLHIARAEAR